MGLGKALLIVGLLCMLRRCDSTDITCLDICGHNAYCTYQLDKTTCNCKSGFTNRYDSSTDRGCIDIDECAAEDICGGKGTCENREGSYWCNCSAGYSNYGNERTPCSELQCDDQFKADSTQYLMWNNCTDLAEGKQSYGHVLLEKNITAVEDLLESPGQLNNSDVTGLLQAVEDAVRLIGPLLQDNYTYIETNQTEVKLAVRKGKTPPTGPIHLSTHSAALDTDWQTATGNGMYPGFALAALVSYKNLEKFINHSFEHLSGHQKDGVDPNYYQVYSKVVSVVVSNPSTELLDTPVSLTLRHLQEDREKNTSVSFICAYWKSGPQGQEGEEGAWATDGCTQQSTNSTHTVCVCEHLSSFAVLMARYPLEELFELQLLTKLGLVASLLCLAVCIFTFRFCPYLRSTSPALGPLTRTTIHLHLCICLFIADVTFLAGISQTKPEVGCRLVAALLHYFFLGTFCWMLLEGVLCYRMVVTVFHASLIGPRYLYTVGYGTPLVIVVISHGILNGMGIKGTGRHCWLPLDRGFMWSFNGPVVLIVALNVFFFIITIWKLAQKFNAINPDLANLRKIKWFTITAVAQVCVLGLTWVFGMLLFTDGTVAVVYIFTILNSPQGVLIFIFHCLLSKKVRQWYIKKLSICTGQENHSSSQSQDSRSPQTRESIRLTQR